MSRRCDDYLAEAASGGLIFLLVLLACLAAFFAPCGCYAGSKIDEIPARCLKEYVK